MSGQDCPACEIREFATADDRPAGTRYCTLREGCIIDELLADMPDQSNRALTQADINSLLGFDTPEFLAHEAAREAARAREDRIREAREAVLEQARQWWEMHSSSNLVGHNPFVTAIKAMVAAEAKEGDR